VRILVTGATGFVGLHTVMALTRAGHQVRLGIRSEEKMRRIYAGHDVDLTDHAVGEITDGEAVARALDGCDAVVHTAAVVDLDARNADYVYRTNLRGTELVIGGAAERGLKSIIYVSSLAALYQRGLEVIDEDTPAAHAKTGYGLSKADSERFALGVLATGAPIAITYPAGILGPDDPGMSEGNQALAFFLNQHCIQTSGGTQWLDVRDLAEAHVRLIEGHKTGRYILAGHLLSWSEFADAIDAVTTRPLNRIYVPGGLMRAFGRAMDAAMRIFRFETLLTHEAMCFATQWIPGDDSKLRRELEMELRPAQETFRDVLYWLAEHEHIDSALIARP
jgi:nucleoside-diphosphate-sugar epimerase